MNPSSVPPVNQLCPRAAFDVVAIAASAGGFKAIREILAALPSEFSAAIIIQMHLDPWHPSLLVELLQPHSPLPAAWAADGGRLQPGTVTVAPPGQHVQVNSSGMLTLTSWTQRNYTKPRADWLFASVASSFKERAIGVILTGQLNDGAQGVQVLSQRGGRVLVQDPDGAEATGMPIATLRTGCADFVLPLHAIPTALTALVMVRGVAQFVAVPYTTYPQPYREAMRLWGSNSNPLAPDTP